MQEKQEQKNPLVIGEFGKIIHDLVMSYGGYVNAHSHLDRADTLDSRYLAHYGIDPLEVVSLPLKVKQVLTGELHKGPAYQDETDLYARMKKCLELAVKTGVRELVSFIDATPDIGLKAVEIAANLKEQFKEQIKFKIAAHPIFGFKDDPKLKTSRWDLFKEACKIADIVGALPEKDDRPDSIGFDEHVKRVITLGMTNNKEMHIHVDQDNDYSREHTLNVIQAVRWLVGEADSEDEEPKIWLIHVLSPSAYPEEKFYKVLEGLKKYNIGVICCPKAAVTMMQMRSLISPIHASMARVLEMALFGIRIKIGTDNIADMFIPSSSGSMLEEVLTLSDNLRFSSPVVLAKLAAGLALNRSDENIVRRHLEEYKKALVKANPDFRFCLPLD